MDLAELVKNVLATVTPQARRKHLGFLVQVPDDLPRADGDRDKLRQVLLNLVGNAIKFTPDGGQITLVASATVRAARCRKPRPPGNCSSRCLDTGIGIPAHLHEKVFDPFFQVDSSSTREYEGTGLGLSIVRRSSRPTAVACG